MVAVSSVLELAAFCTFHARSIHDGFLALKRDGFDVDVLTPEAAIYLTIKIDLKGKKTPEGQVLKDQAAVTSYILREAGLAVVPFAAFGATQASPWYRLSVGTCRLESIPGMILGLREAMEKLG